MSHARNLIRAQFEALVKGQGMTSYNDTAIPVASGNIPAAVIEFESEPIDNESKAHGSHEWTQKRSLIVLLTVLALDPESRDDLCSKLEKEVAQDSSIGNTRSLQGTTFETLGNADLPVFAAAMSYEVTYLTLNTNPDSMLGK